MKFSIRDLLWLTVVVALATAWGVDHFRQANHDLWEVKVFRAPKTGTRYITRLGSLPNSSAPAPNPLKP